MTTYRERPVKVEAVRYIDWTSLPALTAFVGESHVRTLVGKCQIWVEKSQAWCDLEPGGAAVAEPDGSGFYPITASVLESTYVEYEELPPDAEGLEVKDVLVLHGKVDEETCSRLARFTGTLLVVLPEGQILESLDEAQMRGEGWIRERMWLDECGQPCPGSPDRLCVRLKGHDGRGHHSGGHPGPRDVWFDEPLDEEEPSQRGGIRYVLPPSLEGRVDLTVEADP